MPLTVVAITVVYLEFRLDIKGALGGRSKMVIGLFKGSEPEIEASAKAAEKAVLDMAILLVVFADVVVVVALTWVLNRNGDDKLVMSVVAVA
jgi:hypothetical protein